MVALTQIRLPCVNALPDFTLEVPAKATCLTGKLEITLVNDDGENPHTSFTLDEKLEQEADKATPTDGKGTNVLLPCQHLSW